MNLQRARCTQRQREHNKNTKERFVLRCHIRIVFTENLLVAFVSPIGVANCKMSVSI